MRLGVCLGLGASGCLEVPAFLGGGDDEPSIDAAGGAGASDAGGAGASDAGDIATVDAATPGAPDACVPLRHYRDGDGDGYGNPTSYADSCANPGVGWSLDGTDCYDGNAAAHPGQLEYFQGARGDGSYDYDCSSSHELEIPNAAACGSVAGWVTISIPDCGVQSGYVPDAFSGNCPTGTTRTQGCR